MKTDKIGSLSHSARFMHMIHTPYYMDFSYLIFYLGSVLTFDKPIYTAKIQAKIAKMKDLSVYA